MFMPYCQTHFLAVAPKQVEDILSSFAKENFVAGQKAYWLNDGGINIDAGENDIRAYYYENEATIKFFCRDERNMTIYDRKLRAFAAEHSVSLNEESSGYLFDKLTGK